MNYRHKIWKEIATLNGRAKNGKEIENIVKALFKKYNLTSACINYPMEDGSSFPGYICVSINTQQCHGIPNEKPINWRTDTVNVDICFSDSEGNIEDSCQSWGVQTISKKSEELTHYLKDFIDNTTTHQNLAAAAHLWCLMHNVTLCTKYGGHYIGSQMHQGFLGYDLNLAGPQKVLELPEGTHNFTIEPIIQDKLTDNWAQTEVMYYDK